jgi:hypothetical protein
MKVGLVYLGEESAPLAYSRGREASCVYRRPVDVEVDLQVGRDPREDGTLGIIFSMFNRHDRADQHPALDRMGLRSLSVGDIVILGDRAWRCVAVGWESVGPNSIRYAAMS